MKLIAIILSLLISNASLAQTISPTTNGGNPGGPAGGALTGTYPNPTLANVSTVPTSLAVGGCTIGSLIFCVTGQASISSILNVGAVISSGDVRVSSGNLHYWQSRSTMASPSDGVITVANQAQTDFTRLQLGGTSSSFPALGRNGTAAEFKLADNSAYTSFTALTGIFNGLATDATHTDNTVCVDSSTGQLYKGSGALGICLGTSSTRYKTNIKSETEGLAKIAALQPRTFLYKPGYGDDGARPQHGLIAEEVVKVIPSIVGLDVEGKPNTVDLVALIPILIKAIQDQQIQINNLKARR